MESREPDPPEGEASAAQSVSAAEESLRRLQRRLDAASAAAEQLIADAARVTGAPDDPQPPPSGSHTSDGNTAPRAGPDVEALIHFVQSLRDLIPPDLQRRLAEAVRELLLAIRALIDWYLERLDPGRDEPPEVQDIPII